ncbi:MAG: SdiA-regulated domain-containing protein [Zoogloeaceae bacterium]|jgi:uncharacterized protein YjiK|nr:SdiA-regulated domain-containing protein [Zoogloeaceae bacterium]
MLNRPQGFFTIRKKWLKVAVAAVLLSVAMAVSPFQLQWIPLAWYWARLPAQPEGASLRLAGYRVVIDAKVIEGIRGELSGITYNPQTDTLFVAVERNEIAEITTEGRLLRKIPVTGVGDSEDIVHVGGNVFALVDERAKQVYWLYLDSETQAIDAAEAPGMALDVLPSRRNKNLEAVTWDAQKQRLWIGKEKSPMRIIYIDGLTQWRGDALATRNEARSIKQPMRLSILEWKSRQDYGLFLRDLSALFWHAPTRHLLLLSDESAALSEYSPEGELVDIMLLWKGRHGLARAISQAEGVTMDGRGDLYIVSEPNLFYRFEPEAAR